MSDEEEDDGLADLSGDPQIKNAWSWTMLHCECPHCDKVNVLNLGDMSDMTAPDIEVLECWSCGKKSWVMDMEEAELYGYESVEDGFSRKGQERV